MTELAVETPDEEIKRRRRRRINRAASSMVMKKLRILCMCMVDEVAEQRSCFTVGNAGIKLIGDLMKN